MSRSDSGRMHYSEEDLADYFAGDLADDEAAALEAHLGECAECQAAADEPSRRAFAWNQWTPAAHRAAAAMAPPVVPITPRKGFKPFILPVFSAAASVAAGALLIYNLRDNREMQIQARRIAELETQGVSYNRRVAELQAQVAELQKREPQIPDRRPHPPGLPNQPPAAVLAVVTLPAINMQTASLGTGESPRENRDLPVSAPGFRLPLLTPGHAAGSKVHVDLAAPDGTTISRDLTVEVADRMPRVVLELSADQAKPFLNRPAVLSAIIPGHAVLGKVTLALRAQ